MKTRKKIELLAPAGSFAALKSAIANGADAVYLAGKNFGARAFADNFDREKMAEAVRYAHVRGVRIYVTMNTLLNDFELKNALKEVDYYYNIHVDAILIQDLGLYYQIKQRYPDLKLHASTQMHIHNVAGVRFARALGLERAVVARETPLSLLKEMCKENIEIEAFVHGAICVSYSGQCLMSSSLMNRSGNKGVCAQCCRLPYDLLDSESGKKLSVKGNYLLSTRDMNELSDVAQLIEAGVSSLKIEGRMKKPAYVGYITRQYRQAIDAYYAGEKFVVSDEVLRNMEVLFSRGFTDAYLHDKGPRNLYCQQHSNHRGIKIGKVIAVKNGKAEIFLDGDLSQFDGIRFENTKEDGFIVNRLYDRKDYLIHSAGKGDVVKVEINFPLKVGTSVLQTGNFHLEESVAKEGIYRRIPVRFALSAHLGEPLTLTVVCEEDTILIHSEYLVQKALKGSDDKAKLLVHLDRLKDTPFILDSVDFDLDDAVFIPVKILKDLRRKAIEDLIQKREESNPHLFIAADLAPTEVPYLLRDIVEYSSPSQRELAEGNPIFCSEHPVGNDYHLYPVVNPLSLYRDTDRAVISEVGGLLLPIKHKIAGMTLNCSNRSCYEFFRYLGCEAVVLSSELSVREQADLAGDTPEIHHFSYGRRDLMNLKWSPIGAIDSLSSSGRYSLKQNGKKMDLLVRENRNVVLESVAFQNEKGLGLSYRRYTTERAK